MLQEVRRWSLSPSGSSQLQNLELMLKNFKGMKNILVAVTDEMKQSKYSTSVCDYFTGQFYIDGWDDSYGGIDNPHEDEQKGNLYLGQKKYKEIYDLLADLTEQGYDVRPQWHIFRDVLKKIWITLPDFYRGDTQYKISPPESYDPEKPFPILQFPDDID